MDGFGAQYQAIMSGIAYCNYMNYKYIHSPFVAVEHGGNVEKLNQFIGIPSSNETDADIRRESHCKAVHYSETPDIYYNSHVLSILRQYYYSTPKPNIKTSIALHIRRGDVNKNDHPTRYTDNNKYKEIICFLLKTYPNDIITIFSEGTINDFHDLQQDRVIFQLNSSVEETFHSFVRAKVLVTAKSSFSYCAALLNENEVYYMPFWHNPLKHWKVIPPQDFKDKVVFI